jgi:putative ATP-dependent endonuclease of OLD family
VFALLSAIAELKKENIIFAMEEPEIAVPPHTQRRIINYLLNNTTQSFVTSHSPYVIEKFEPENIKILNKDSKGVISGVDISYSSGLKPKNYRRKIRHAIAEVILGNAVIVGEGLTEMETLNAAASILELNPENYPFDLSGVTIFEADGDGTILNWGKFFKSIDIKTFAFFDYMERSEDEKKELETTFELYKEIDQKEIEKLLVAEVPTEIQWDYLNELRDAGAISSGPFIPAERPSDSDIRDFMYEVLKQKKGERRSASLVEKCSEDQLPPTIKSFLKEIFKRFPQPEKVAPLDLSKKEDEPSDSTEEE